MTLNSAEQLSVIPMHVRNITRSAHKRVLPAAFSRPKQVTGVALDGAGAHLSDMCAICLDDFDCSECGIRAPFKCTHAFHEACVKRWTNACGNLCASCPTCRAGVESADGTPEDLVSKLPDGWCVRIISCYTEDDEPDPDNDGETTVVEASKAIDNGIRRKFTAAEREVFDELVEAMAYRLQWVREMAPQDFQTMMRCYGSEDASTLRPSEDADGQWRPMMMPSFESLLVRSAQPGIERLEEHFDASGLTNPPADWYERLFADDPVVAVTTVRTLVGRRLDGYADITYLSRRGPNNDQDEHVAEREVRDERRECSQCDNCEWRVRGWPRRLRCSSCGATADDKERDFEGLV